MCGWDVCIRGEHRLFLICPCVSRRGIKAIFTSHLQSNRQLNPISTRQTQMTTGEFLRCGGLNANHAKHQHQSGLPVPSAVIKSDTSCTCEGTKKKEKKKKAFPDRIGLCGRHRHGRSYVSPIGKEACRTSSSQDSYGNIQRPPAPTVSQPCPLRVWNFIDGWRCSHSPQFGQQRWVPTQGVAGKRRPVTQGQDSG